MSRLCVVVAWATLVPMSPAAHVGCANPPLQPPGYTLGAGVSAAGDFNGDGIRDFVVRNNTLTVHVGTPDGAYAPAFSQPAAGTTVSISAGDFNGDGLTDVVYSTENHPVRSIQVAMNRGASFEVTLHALPVNDTLTRVYVGDFDGDADLDIVGLSWMDDINFFLNDGEGNFAWNFALGTFQGELARVADIDGDGRMDLAVTSYNLASTLAVIFFGDPSGGVVPTEIREFTRPVGRGNVEVGDFDGDDDVDVICVVRGQVALQNDGGRQFTYLPLDGRPVFVQNPSLRTAAGDFDGDGDTDLIRRFDSSTVHHLRLCGPFQFVLVPQPTRGEGAKLEQSTETWYATDIDGDAVADFVNGQVWNSPMRLHRGDLNCDGAVSIADVGPFVQALTATPEYLAEHPSCGTIMGDMNDDDSLSLSDIAGFVQRLTGS